MQEDFSKAPRACQSSLGTPHICHCEPPQAAKQSPARHRQLASSYKFLTKD